MLTLSILQSFCFSSHPQAPKGDRAEFAGDDVPAGGAAKTAGMDPATTSARVVTIAVAGTSPSAGVTLPPATRSQCRW
jgi:hypothetical protein